MSTQPALNSTRHSSRTRSSVLKRALSVDDIDVTLPGGKPTSGRVVINSKRRRKQKQDTSMSHTDKNDQNDSSKTIDDVAPVVDSENMTDCNDLLLEINTLKATVSTLQNQLNFVLSLLGITGNTDMLHAANSGTVSKLNRDAENKQDSITLLPSSSPLSPTLVSDGMNTTGDNGRSFETVQLQRHSYASTVMKPSALSAPFRQAVVSAVYADFEEKDRRAKNVVISGLSASSLSDKSAVENLCYTEFGFTPKVTRCRRLGQPRTDRVQPLLVVLESVTDAEFLVKNARSLRQSNDPRIRNSVYVNADLTKAEALTAYQRRCRRRELSAAAATRVSQQEDLVPQSITVLNTRLLPSNQTTSTATSTTRTESNGELSTVDIDVQHGTDDGNPTLVSNGL